MDNLNEIEDRLRKDLHVAGQRFESTTREFGAVTAAVPSGIPYPDSVTRLKQVGAERRDATEALRDALRRWNEFVLDGKVPDDLAESLDERKPKAATNAS